MPLRSVLAGAIMLLLSACGSRATWPDAHGRAAALGAPRHASSPVTPAATDPASVSPAPPAPSPSPTVDPRLLAAVDAERALESRNQAELLARLRTTALVVDSAGAGETRRTQAARLEQVAFQQLVAQPEWQPAVLGSLSGKGAARARAAVAAATELNGIGDPADSLPHWRITAPPPAPALLADYHDAGTAFGIGWQYLAAINLVETQTCRIQGPSWAGAQGPMQFMPATWAAYGQGDVNNPRDAIFAAARYLHAVGAPADMDAAIYSYNLSHHYVRAVDDYAALFAADPTQFDVLYRWQVLLGTTSGIALLPEGWSN